MTHCSSRDAPALVILAAGLGRRFGGCKPLAAVGDTGKPLMHFSVMDARRAGIEKLVVVVNPANAARVEKQFLPLLPAGLEAVFAIQDPADIPGGCLATPREKPWGTAHALWCARAAVNGPCIVINADDYYGASAFARLTAHFAESDDWAMVSYPLARTLSAFGEVNRGLCRIADGYLVSIRECRAISRSPQGIRGELEGERISLDPDTPVSMNLWGFGPAVFDGLERGLIRFFRGLEPGGDAECYLPEQVMASVASGAARVRVYPGRERWLGVTYREDLERLGEAFGGAG